jgi:type III pantothenate kinase
VIATGGLAVLFEKQTGVRHIEPELTIQGLAMLWERSRTA